MISWIFLSYAEIGRSTKNWEFWRDRGMDDNEYLKHSTRFLDAISFHLKITRMEAEELTCRFKQHSTKTEGRYRDVLFAMNPIFFVDFETSSVSYKFKDGSIQQSEYSPMDMVPMFGKNAHTAYWDTKFQGKFKGMPAKNSAARGSKKQQQPKDYFPLRSVPPSRRGLALTNSRLATLRVPSREVVIMHPRRDRAGSVDLAMVVATVVFGVQEICGRQKPKKHSQYYKVDTLVVHPGTSELRVVATPKTIRKHTVSGPAKPSCRQARKKRERQQGGSKHPRNRMTRKQKVAAKLRQPAEFDGIKFWAAGVKIPGWEDTSPAFPDPDFELRSDYRYNDGVFGQPGLALCESFAYRGTRWFRKRESALDFAKWSILFSRKHDYFMSPLVTNLLHVQSADGTELMEEEDWFTGEPGVAGSTISAMRVSCRAGNRSYLPYLVSARYQKGGTCHYLTDDTGIRTSGIILRMPPPMAYRTESDEDSGASILSEELQPFIAVVGHDFAGVSKPGVRLRVLWVDNSTTYECFSQFVSDNRWHVQEYATRNNLFAVKGFGTLRSKSGLPIQRNVATIPYEGFLEIDVESKPEGEERRLEIYKKQMTQK
jgi:hypothetical protein